MTSKLSGLVLASTIALSAQQASAVEGSIETYLLGSRDSFAGVLPPAGNYLNNDFIMFNGTTPTLSLGGVAVVDPDISVFTYKYNFTHVFKEPIGNARAAINVNVPYVSASLDFSGVIGNRLSGTLSDSEDALADITVTPILAWTSGKLNTSLAMQFFLPTGKYSAASVDAAGRSVDVLNTGKNRFAFDPTVSMTWFDPESGWEVSGALGVTFSAKNETTDYQTAPEAHFEGTVMYHMPNKLALGLSGYAYHQIGDDSGAGAEAFRRQIGANSLEARVYGIGPLATWSTKIGQTPVSFKAKYITEFGAKRRFESDKFSFTMGVSF